MIHGQLFKLAIVILVLDCGVSHSVLARNLGVKESFEAHQIVPDVISRAPDRLAKVKYPSGEVVSLGNELTPTSVKDVPTVSWAAELNQYYLLAFVDPDAPSRSEPTSRESQHWLVGNIQGNQVDHSDVLTEFVGSGPGLDSGLHRYVFLVYKQPSHLYFDEPYINNTSMEGRRAFSISDFAQKYQLGNPVAGNFFQVEYDDYVPILHESLGV